jgi:hypothetical protein
MLDASASAIRNGTGGRPRRSHTSSVPGAISSTVVTLSTAAEATAVMTTSMTMGANGRPLVFFAWPARRAHRNPPDRRLAMGVAEAPATGTGLRRNSPIDAFSEADIQAMRIMSGCTATAWRPCSEQLNRPTSGPRKADAAPACQAGAAGSPAGRVMAGGPDVDLWSDGL